MYVCVKREEKTNESDLQSNSGPWSVVEGEASVSLHGDTTQHDFECEEELNSYSSSSSSSNSADENASDTDEEGYAWLDALGETQQGEDPAEDHEVHVCALALHVHTLILRRTRDSETTACGRTLSSKETSLQVCAAAFASRLSFHGDRGDCYPTDVGQTSEMASGDLLSHGLKCPPVRAATEW